MNEIILLSDKMLIAISLILTILFIAIIHNRKIEKKKVKAIFLMYCNIILNLYIFYYLQTEFMIEHLIMSIMIIFSVINLIILKCLKLYNEKIGVFFCIVIIFAVQIGYVSYTPFYNRQHDSRNFYAPEYGGHFGYIGYIFNNNSLPTGSPKDVWCFYNPPLFYIVSTIFLKIQTVIGNTIEIGFENLQILAVFYATIFNIYVYRILKEIDVKKSLVPMVAFVGLSPAMIIMSGSLNNDMLSIMLSTMAIFYTIKWYKKEEFKNLLKIALTISLAIMTKISSALIAVAIAMVFLVRIIKNKTEIKKYIKQFTIFAIIALPIGLWFPIKNLILYDVPITYVQSVDLSNGANISEYSILERFFSISNENLDTINVVMEKPNIDYNIFLTTIKSFIVDEYIDYENNTAMNISINIVFYSTIILFLLFIPTIIYIVKNYKKIKNDWILLFGLIFILSAISYIKFCFDYPFTFTMNFRYIVPTLISYVTLTGIACDNNKKIRYANLITIEVFCIASIMLFINLV